MTAPGFYAPGEGFLYRLDPRVKLWYALLGVALCAISGQVAVLAASLLLTQIILLTGGVTAGRTGRVWRSLAPLVAVILVLQPLLAPGDGPAILTLGPLRITAAGLLTGLRYGLRVAGAAFAVLVPVLTTPIHVLVRAFQKLGLPYSWAMTIGLALRYLGTVGELYTTISEAQQARGWDLSQGGLVKRAKAAVPALIALIVASLRLSDTLALGLAARGFGLAGQRTHYHDVTFRPADWAALAAITTAFAGALVLLFG
jgi:energy-coupling factor transport system permease protein